jgi:hypothetical protein
VSAEFQTLCTSFLFFFSIISIWVALVKLGIDCLLNGGAVVKHGADGIELALPSAISAGAWVGNILMCSPLVQRNLGLHQVANDTVDTLPKGTYREDVVANFELVVERRLRSGGALYLPQQGKNSTL